MSDGRDNFWDQPPEDDEPDPQPRPKGKAKSPPKAKVNGNGNGAEASVGIGNWMARLQWTRGSKDRPPEIKPTYSNLEIILAHDPELAKLLGYDEFLDQPVIVRPPPANFGLSHVPGPYPRPWCEEDVSAFHSHAERHYTDKFRQPGPVERAMRQVAGNMRFHPLRDWINDLVWDGERRLDGWLRHVFGVPDTAYTRAVASKTLVAAVRRVRRPGCKFDHILVLQGPQDFAKSLAVETLATSRYFSDSLPLNFADKDAMIGLRGHWFIELAEIEHLDRNTSRLAKAFITRHTDIYRLPYGRHQITAERQCIMIGTTNEQHYLRDDTGNRRYWPIQCEHKADLDWLADNREQLFAEAAQRDTEGETLWIDAELMSDAHREAMHAQAERLEAHDDPWVRPIMDYLDGTLPLREDMDGRPMPAPRHDHVTMAVLLSQAGQVPRGQQNVGHSRRAARILRSMGWADKKSDSDTEPYERDIRYWFRPG